MEENATKKSSVTQASDDYSLERVPEKELTGWLDITLTWTGFVIYPGGILFGFVLANAFTFWQAIALLLLGSLSVSLVACFMGYIGKRERVGYALSTRIGFGYRGSAVPSFLMFFTNVGWCSVNLVSLVAFFGDIPNWLKVIAIVGFCVLFTLTSRRGMNRGLKLFARLAVPLLIVVCIIVVIIAPRHGGGWSAVTSWVPPQLGTITLGAGFAMALGSWISGSMMAGDVTRFARDTKGVIIGSFGSFIVGFLGLGFVGIILGVCTGSAEIAPAFNAIGIGWLAFVSILLCVWTTLQTQIYSTSLALANVLHKSRIFCENISAVCIMVVASGMTILAGLENSFISIITLFGIIVPPVPGIIIVEYFLVRKMKTPLNINDFAKFNYRGLISYAICILVYVVLYIMNVESWFFQTPLFAAIVHVIVSYKILFGKGTVVDNVTTP
ncbi:cytosine permease [Ruminococcaceae bacterium OttesenSCG-928-I18]|nr:cytosine permease [Ruminococcaceae bacterium OttesenSCG-928-I18]